MKIGIIGINGRLGQTLYRVAKGISGVSVEFGVDMANNAETSCPVYHSICEVRKKVEVVIDFSAPPAINDEMKNFVEKCQAAYVICSTGLSGSQLKVARKIAERVPVVVAENAAYGIFVMKKAAEVITKMFDGTDIVINEIHRKGKKDTPSGTAKMLKNGIIGALNGNCDININSVRAGSFVGTHEVIFARGDEVISIKHIAMSREIFCEGAIKLAAIVKDMPRGLYTAEECFMGK